MTTSFNRLRLLLIVALLCLGGASTLAGDAAAPPATTLTGVLDDCSSLSLAPQGRHIKNQVTRIGHLEITINEGTAVPVIGKSGQPLGIFIEGSGGYRYSVAGAEDRASFAANVAHVAKLLRASDNGLTDRFSRVLILFTQPMFQEVWDAAAGGEPVTAPASRSSLQDLLKTSYPEFAFRTALSRLNGIGRYVFVGFDGGLERIGYVYDDVLDGREHLFNFRKLIDYSDVLFAETLSYQSIPGWTPGRDPEVTLTNAAIAVETADNKTGSITSTLTLRVRDANTRALDLALINHVNPDSASWTSSKNRLTVAHVTSASGAELTFAHRYHELIVEIPPTTTDDSDVVIRVETAGEVFLDINGRHSDNYFILHLFSWFPEPMSWGGEHFAYTLKVKTRKPWRPVTSGRETSLRDEGDSFVAESHGDNAHLIGVLAGKYVTREETIDGLTVRVHAYAAARKNVIENLPKLTAALANFFSGLLGPMPVDELDVVEIPDYGFGYSPSGIVLITSEAYKARDNDVAEYLSRGINARLAHEVAHQWFGHKAWPRDASGHWLNESFAEYFSGLAMGALAQNDKTVVGFERMHAEWRTDAALCADVAPISMADSLGGESGGRDQRCLLYSRGPLVLHMLRTSIGDNRFIAATKKFLDTANRGPATTDDYARAVSDVVQKDMHWFFDQWIRGTGTPRVDVEHHVDAAADGQYRLWGTVRQAAGDGFKKLLVPLVWERNGEADGRIVFANEPETKFEFVLPFKPGSVKPDPFQNNLATYK